MTKKVQLFSTLNLIRQIIIVWRIDAEQFGYQYYDNLTKMCKTFQLSVPTMLQVGIMYSIIVTW